MAIKRIVTKILVGKNPSSSNIPGGQQRGRIWITAAVAAGLQVLPGSGVWAQEALKFGVADPLTGPSAIFGLDQMQAVRWAVEDINAKGGINGRKLEAIIADHQAKPEVGIAVVNKFTSVDKVPVFITAFSSVVKAVASIADREKVLMLSVGANSRCARVAWRWRQSSWS